MMAFLKFRDDKVDYAVLECGLGGRLDATNVVSPDVCAITSVGWDHMEALGDTLENSCHLVLPFPEKQQNGKIGWLHV